MAMKKSSGIDKYQQNQFAGYKGKNTVFGTTTEATTQAGSRTARNRGKRRPD